MDNVNLDPFAVEGHATVQLFDAKTGKQVDEQSGRNFLSRALTERILRTAQRYAFAHQHPTQWDDCIWARFDHAADSAGFFQWMVLTDSAMAEAPATERAVPGTIIGYSNRQTHTDADLRRGNINRSECSHHPARTRWVMDWPTDRGNGTIQSICWTINPLGNVALPDRLGCDALFRWRSGIGVGQCCSYEGDYWISSSGGNNIRRLAADTGVLLWTSPTLPTIASSHPPLAVRGDRILFVESAGTLRRLIISTGVVSASLGSISSVSTVVFIGDILYIFPGTSHAAGSTLTMRRFNDATSEWLTNLSIPSLPAGVDTRNAFPMGGNVVRIGPGNALSGFYHDVDIGTLTVTPLGFQSPAQTFLARMGVVNLWVPFQTTTYVSGTAMSAEGMIYEVASMAGNFLLSRIRLASPITKTSANTLKVIYDFHYV